mgnify:CR=1 FL=1
MTQHINVIQRFINHESFSGILLFISALLAVIVANSAFSEYYFALWNIELGATIAGTEASMSLMYWINDGLMALFFLMVGLEIKRELVIGELSSVKQASFPIVAAIGGMIVPALVYVGFNTDNPMGFGVPMATDIAFALGILMLLGKRVSTSIKVFLVALAVVDDLGAILIVATVYTKELHLEYFVHVIIIYGLIWGLNYKRVTSLLPYLLLGAALWIYIHAIGIHATIAGVLLAFAIPLTSKVNEDEFIKDTKDAIDEFEKHRDDIPLLNHHQIDELENIAYNYDKVQNPLVKLEHQLHGFSAYVIMPLFAFANAGVILDFSAVSANLSIVLGVVMGLLLGKPIGIFLFTYFGSKFGIIKKPDDITWREVVAVGFVAGIGFTMSIFITALAFLDPTTIGAVKIGIFIASFLAGVIGVVLLIQTSKAKEKAANN